MRPMTMRVVAASLACRTGHLEKYAMSMDYHQQGHSAAGPCVHMTKQCSLSRLIFGRLAPDHVRLAG